MKPIVKKIIIASALTLLGLSLMASDKITRLSEIFERITIKPASLPKSIKFYNPNNLGIPQNVSFLIDLKITNPDYESFTASGFGVAKLSTVDVFFKNNHIGTADVNLEDIDVPAQGSYILKDLKVSGNTFSILANANSFQNLNLTDLQFIANIEVLGIDYEIGN